MTRPHLQFKVARPPLRDSITPIERQYYLADPAARFVPTQRTLAMSKRVRLIVRKILETARIGVQ